MTAAADVGATLGEVRPFLLKLARLQLRSEALAEDVVSETVIAAIEQADVFQGRSKVRTWVVGILRHKILDQLRRQMREVSIEQQLEEGEIGSIDDLYEQRGALLRPPQEWGDPELTCHSHEFIDAMQACLDLLPEKQGLAFTMREWLEFETPEICARLGITQAHCNVMLFRARIRLRQCIEANWLRDSCADCRP